MKDEKYLKEEIRPTVVCPKCGHEFPGNLIIKKYDGTAMLADKIAKELSEEAE